MSTNGFETLRKQGLRALKRPEPLWRGPEKDGITQSLISTFFTCRERFRLHVVDGLREDIGFSSRIEYGDFIHLCEELAPRGEDYYQRALKERASGLAKQHPTQMSEIKKWYRIAKIQYPIYRDYWKDYWKREKLSFVSTEIPFCVPYPLPSGRVPLLRGKIDGVLKSPSGLMLLEHKVKGWPDELQMRKQLRFDFQTMTYVVSLSVIRYMLENGYPVLSDDAEPIHPLPQEIERKTATALLGSPLHGVLYNIIRRPLSGGKGTIRPKKPTKGNPQGETEDEYYTRLEGVLLENQDEYFYRWKTRITTADIRKFETVCLIPILESLCDWWEWIREDPYNPLREGNTVHWQMPYGIYNPIPDGKPTAYDRYLEDGSQSGLVRVNDLFPELRGDK